MIPQETKTAINSWLAANGGPRRFEPGASADTNILFAYMRERGFECRCVGFGRALRVLMSSGKGRPRRVSFPDFLDIIDEYRISDGLEPFSPRGMGG